ncbi:MAG: DUF1573 domain-containing protein [Patescibacteria group bacterium]
MKKAYITIAILIVVVGVIYVSKTLKKEPLGPVISVIPIKNDIGTVVYGEVARYAIKIKNIGDQDLIIQKISTSCGCTKAQITESDKIIAPGKEVDVNVSFDPATHKDDSDMGEIIRMIYIKSNDPKTPEVQSELNAFVIKKEETAATSTKN